MKNYDMKSYQKKIKHEMDDGSYQHTLGVMYTCAALAMRYEYDIQKAQLAGLLHDCAKCIPNGKKLKLCEKHNIQITEVERRNPFLLHAKLGAFLVMHEYGVNDKEIVSAILNHTTGKPNMSLLDKIIYVADYIEPGRVFPGVKEARELALIDLDEAVAFETKHTLAHLIEQEQQIYPKTIETYNRWVAQK